MTDQRGQARKHGGGNNSVQLVVNADLEERPSQSSTPGAGAPPAGLGARPHPWPACAGPGSRYPGLRARGLRGPNPVASPTRNRSSSLLFRRTAAAPRHRAPHARLLAPCPRQDEGHPSKVNRPAAEAAGTHPVPAPTCHPATAPQPQPPGRLILPREAGRLGGGGRRSKRAVTSGLLPFPIWFGSVTGSDLLRAPFFLRAEGKELL